MQRSQSIHRFASRRGAALAGALVLLAGVGPARAGGATYDLVLDVPAGKLLHYRLDSQSDGNFQGSAFTQMVVADVEMSRVDDPKAANPVFLLHFLKVEASARQGGELQPQEFGLDGMKAQVEVTKRGRVVKVDAPPEASDVQRHLLANFADALYVELPETPVKVGDSWKLDLSKGGGATSGKGDFTLESVDTKQGVQVAKISGDVEVANQSPALAGKGHMQSEIAIAGGYALLAKGSVDLKGDGPSIVQSFELKLKP